MPGQLFTYFIIFLIYTAMSCMLFALKKAQWKSVSSYTLTFITCVFLCRSCSCHCGLFHSGVLSCIFWTLGYFIQTCVHLVLSWFSHFWQKNGFVDAIGFPQPHPLQALTLAVTVMDTFLLCASSTSIAQLFCLRAVPKAKGADSAPIWGWDEVSPLQLGLGAAAGEYSCLSLFEGMIQMVKNLPAMWDTGVQSLSRKDPLGKKMATASSILAWRVPWTEKMAGLRSMGSQSQTRLRD